LCEQVVGRGLRRTSYEVNPETGLFQPEYVHIFGVPFTFLPHEGSADAPPPPPATGQTRIAPLPERRAPYEVAWPKVIRFYNEKRAYEIDRCTATSRMVEAAIGLNPFTR